MYRYIDTYLRIRSIRNFCKTHIIETKPLIFYALPPGDRN